MIYRVWGIVDHIEYSPAPVGEPSLQALSAQVIIVSRGIFGAHRRPCKIREGFLEEVTVNLRFER